MSFGKRLREERERLGLGQEEISSIGGVSRRSQSMYEQDNTEAGAEYLSLIAAAGADVAYILTGARSQAIQIQSTAAPEEDSPAMPSPSDDFVYVPRFDLAVHAGPGAVCEVDEIRDRLAFRRDWIREMGFQANRLALVDVRGDSMEPTLAEGDVVLVNLGEDVREDGIYVLRRDDGVVVKRIQTTISGDLYIRSDNPRYSEERIPKELLDQVRVAGRVVWLGRRI